MIYNDWAGNLAAEKPANAAGSHPETNPVTDRSLCNAYSACGPKSDWIFEDNDIRNSTEQYDDITDDDSDECLESDTSNCDSLSNI